MDLKIIGKNLNKANMKILKDTLGKINPNIGRKLISWVIQHPRYLKIFFLFIRHTAMPNKLGKKIFAFDTDRRKYFSLLKRLLA